MLTKPAHGGTRDAQLNALNKLMKAKKIKLTSFENFFIRVLLDKWNNVPDGKDENGKQQYRPEHFTASITELAALSGICKSAIYENKLREKLQEKGYIQFESHSGKPSTYWITDFVELKEMLLPGETEQQTETTEPAQEEATQTADTSAGNGGIDNISKKRRKSATAEEKQHQEAQFNRFYEVYPKKRHRPSALKAWKRIAPDDDTVESIIASVEYQKRNDAQWLKDNGQYIPHPATYLNQEGWKDMPPGTGTDIKPKRSGYIELE